MKVKLATKRIGALALSLLIGLGSCVTTNIQKAYATDELESQASDSVSSATTSGGDAVTLADALGSEDEDTGIAPLGLGDQYTVTFNLNGGTFDFVNNQTLSNPKTTVEEGQTVANPGYPIKYERDPNDLIGYIVRKLSAWTLDGEVYDFSTPVTSDIELVATYEPMYVTYDGNGGLLSYGSEQDGLFQNQSSETREADGEITDILKLITADRENYTFAGWNSKADGTGTTEIPDDTYGRYSFGQFLNSINYVNIGGDLAFYAQWLGGSETKHIVTFELYDGEFIPQNNTYIYQDKLIVEVEDGQLVENPGYPVMIDSTYYGGWETYRLRCWKNGGSEFSFDTPITSDLTLNASYTEMMITYDADGGLINNTEDPWGEIVNQPSVTVPYNSNYFTAAGLKPTKEGYKFLNWYIDKPWGFLNSINYSSVGGDIVAKPDYIRETPKYKVTFNLNGGTLDPSKVTSDNKVITVEEGQTVQNPGYPVKYEEIAGSYDVIYKLDKWTLDGEEYDFSTPITHDIELTATYTDMNVTYDGNGGLLTAATAFGTFTDQSAVTKKLNRGTPVLLFFTRGTREGYTYDGFNDKADGTGTTEIPYGVSATGIVDSIGKYLSDINYTSVGGDITFYAKWTQVPNHTVTFHLDGGTLDYSESTPSADIVVSVPDGQTVAKPATNPILYSDNGSGSGYRYSRLEKWTLNDNEYDFNTPVTSDLELDANYTPINVTLHGNGGLITSSDVIYQCGSQNFYDVEEVTLILNDLVQHQMSQVSGKRTGYKMQTSEYGKVWTQNADGSGVTMRYLTADESAGNIVKSTFGEYLEQIGYTDGDIDLYAQWVEDAEIEGKFDPMNGGAVITKTTVTVNGNKVFEKPADPEKEGYELLGWVDATKYDEFMNFTTGYLEIKNLSGGTTYKTSSVAEALESGYYNIANEYYGASRYLYDFDTAVTSNMKFKAVYNKKKCNLNFVIVGHKDCNRCNLLRMGTKFASCYLGSRNNLIDITTYKQYKDEYELYGHVEGWYTDENCTPGNEVDLDNTKFDSLNVEKDGDTYVATIYGKFVFNTTEVWIAPNNDNSRNFYDLNSSPNYKLGDLMVGHTLEQSGLTLPVVTREGSTFQGWTEKEFFSAKDMEEIYGDSYDAVGQFLLYNRGWVYDCEVIDPSVTPDTIYTRVYTENPDDEYSKIKDYIYEKIVYVANWDYKVVIDYDNGIEPTEEYVVKFNEATPKLKVPVAKEGYTFAGWATKFWSVPGEASGYTYLVYEGIQDGNTHNSFATNYKKITEYREMSGKSDKYIEESMGKEGEYLRVGYNDSGNTPDQASDVTYIKAIWIKNDSHQHTWFTGWSSDDNNHWHDSSCGHDIKKDQAPHTPSDWVIDKQPTSSSEGLKHKECTVCHKVLETGKIAKIEIIIQPEATPTPSATPVPSATPTAEPKHEHEFSKEWTTNESSHWHDATCGHDVRDGEAPHTPSDWIVAKQPTETEEGYRYKECTVCYDVLETEIIDRLSSMIIEVPEEPDPQPVVEETVTEEPIETPAPVVTPAPTTKEDKVIVAPVFDNGDQDAENMQGAMGRFLEGVKTVAVVLSISLATILGILGLLLLILAAMRRVKVQNDRSGDYEESNFVTVYKTSVSTEGSRIAQLFRKNDRVWNVVIPEEVVADRVTDFFKVVLTKSFCKRYNGEQLIVIMDSEDDQVKKQFGFVIDGEDNEINITIKE